MKLTTLVIPVHDKLNNVTPELPVFKFIWQIGQIFKVKAKKLKKYLTN